MTILRQFGRRPRSHSAAMTLATLAAAASVVLAAVPLVARGSSPPRPNIIIIMSDDMGYSDIECYGGEIRTPTLNRLADGGVRFSQFYNMARCCPTRASLLTGLHPHQAGMGHMTGAPKNRNEYWRGNLSDRAVTIAQVLKTGGYATYMCGKWHVTRRERAGDEPYNWPLQRGFDRFYGTITGAGSFYDPTTLTRDNTMITPENDPEYHPEHFYYTDAISDNAARYIAEHKAGKAGQPFFLYVAYTAAHWPMHAPEESIAKYRGVYDGGYEPIRQARFRRLRDSGLINPRWALSPQFGDWSKVEHKSWEARCMEVYAAMIDRMDEGIGRIVDQLEKDRLLDDTLIFFLQDNGGCAERQGRTEPPAWDLKDLQPMGPDELQTRIWPPMQTRDGRAVRGGPDVMPGGPDTYIAYGEAWANVSNTPFREYKHWVHEGGIATPLIAHWPRGIQRRGAIDHQPGQVIDLMATCVDLAGAEYPTSNDGKSIHPLEGKSLAPAFTGRAIDRDALYWEHEGNRAVRMGKWKLVAKGPAGAWELYDLENDRTELHDLSSQQPERVAMMVAKWEAWARRAGVLPWIWKPQYPAAARDQADQPEDEFEGARREVYKRVGDIELTAHIFVPPDHKPSDSRAAIIFFFGGGWRNGSAAQFVPQCKHLASRGMVAITADYRVHGRHQAMIADCAADAQSAVRWVRAHASDLGIDPERIAASGGSAGGHLAAAAAMLKDFTQDEDSSTSFRPNALVLFNPVLDLTPEPGGEKQRLRIEARLGAEARDLSPMDHIRPGLPPAIIFHGKSDALVPFESIEAFTRKMEAVGNRCELVGFEGRSHGFFNFGRSQNKYYHETLSHTERFLTSLGFMQ